jgi:ATP-binding cassette subfamily B protein
MSKKTSAPTQNTQLPGTPLRFFWHVSKKYKWWALAAIVAVSAASTAGVFLRLMIELIVNGIESNGVSDVVFYSLMYPVAYFVIAVIWRISGVAGSFWLLGAPKETTDVLSQYSSSHSHGYFSDRFAGSLSNKISNVSRSMENFVATFLWSFLENTIPLVLTAVIFWRTDWMVGAAFILLVAVSLTLNILLLPRKRRLSLAVAKAQSKTTGFVVDIISNITAVRQFSQGNKEFTGLQEYTDEVRKKGSRSFIYSEYMMFVNSLVFTAFALFMFITLTDKWAVGEITSGRLVSFILLVTYSSSTFIFLGRIVSHFAKFYGQAEEGLQELVIPHEIIDQPDALDLGIQEAAIAWSGVQFSFDNNAVFADFDLTIPGGQRLGLVGQSGAGKTTFVSLLLRQHELTGGSISIDGQDISTVTQDSLRRAIAIVPQEPALFHRTIKENILYGKPDATDQEIIAVAEKAQAHEFISALPDGYDTMVGERGVKLSGGQKQRVAIARAMLKDAPILVLDEATSALDSESEVAIQKALENLMEGRTVIAIAHRLSTLRKMDRIIVLENGQIKEDGTHDSLATGGGIYERLWNHQAGGFLQETN